MQCPSDIPTLEVTPQLKTVEVPPLDIVEMGYPLPKAVDVSLMDLTELKWRVLRTSPRSSGWSSSTKNSYLKLGSQRQLRFCKVGTQI